MSTPHPRSKIWNVHYLLFILPRLSSLSLHFLQDIWSDSKFPTGSSFIRSGVAGAPSRPIISNDLSYYAFVIVSLTWLSYFLSRDYLSDINSLSFLLIFGFSKRFLFNVNTFHVVSNIVYGINTEVIGYTQVFCAYKTHGILQYILWVRNRFKTSFV